MATAPFICDVEASEDSLRTAVSRHQLRHRVCSYTLLQVLVGVLTVLVLALTGGVISMKLFQSKVIQVWNNMKDCPVEVWRAKFTGTNTCFISPRTQKYVISGNVFTKENDSNCKINSFRLLRKQANDTRPNEAQDEIMKQTISEIFRKDDVQLLKGETLSIWLNCKNLTIDEDRSELFIYQQNSC